jgi:hypothetical protein
VSFYYCFLFILELGYFRGERLISLLKAGELKLECLPLSFGSLLIGLLLRLHIVNVDFELLLYLYTRFVRYDNPMIKWKNEESTYRDVLADASLILPHLLLVPFDEFLDPRVLGQMLHVESCGGTVIVI